MHPPLYHLSSPASVPEFHLRVVGVVATHGPPGPGRRNFRDHCRFRNRRRLPCRPWRLSRLASSNKSATCTEQATLTLGPDPLHRMKCASSYERAEREFTGPHVHPVSSSVATA